MIAPRSSHLPRVNSFIFIGASGVLAIVAAFNPGELFSIALCAGLSLTLPASLLVRRVRSHGMTDPVALFCLGFVAYNAALLARVAMVGGAQNLETPYPIQFDNSAFLHVGLLNVLSALCITFTEMMFLETRQCPRSLPLSLSPKHYFWAGIAVYTIGAIFYYLNMTALGGILAFYTLDRGQRLLKPRWRNNLSRNRMSHRWLSLALLCESCPKKQVRNRLHCGSYRLLVSDNDSRG